MIQTIKRFNPYFLIFLIVVLGYWQISFLVYSLQWDAIDVVFPFRFYFSESIQAGYFPFWNPYQQTGTPFFADLQAPTYYPELLFTGLTTGYSIYIMQFFFILYTVVAALGMYRLAFYFNKNKGASLIAGFAYAFCGFMIGHGQHFFLLVGSAWIPFVLLNYLILCREPKAIHALKTAIFIFLMITGAYQALSFTLFYLILLLFVYFILKALKRREFKSIYKLFIANLILFLIVIVFSLPLIASTIEILSSVDRLESGITLSQASQYGQNLKSLISFILPFSTLKYREFFNGVDMSMINHYIGLIPLIFFWAALFSKRSKQEYLILVFGLVIIASSFGFLPVREFMFKYIPFMNLYKYAAYIRIFGLLAMILIASNYLAFFQDNITKEKKKIFIISGALILIVLFLFGYSVTKLSWSDFTVLSFQNGFHELFKSLSFYQHVFLQSLFQLSIILVFWAVILYRKRIRRPQYLLYFLIVTELFVAAQLNMSFTVGGSSSKPRQMQADLALYPDGFPIPVDSKIVLNDQKHAAFYPFWRNTYIFTKQVSFGAFSSFELNSYSKLDDDYPNLRNAVLNNKLCFFSDTILPLHRFIDDSIDAESDTKLLFLSDDDFLTLSEKEVFTDSLDKVNILEFTPNNVIIETHSGNDQFLTMLQTNFPGWKAYLNEEEVPVYTSNFNYRTIFLPEGKHRVKFEYSNNKIVVLYIISNTIFFLCILFLLGYWFYNKNKTVRLYVFVPSIVLILSLVFVVKRVTSEDNPQTTFQRSIEKWTEKSSVFHFEQNFEDKTYNPDTSEKISNESVGFFSAETEYYNIIEIVNENGKLKNGTIVVTAKFFPTTYDEVLLASEVIGKATQNRWHTLKLERQIENLNTWNDMIYYRNIYKLEENDKIKLYIWNISKSEFKMDSIRVDFYPL